MANLSKLSRAEYYIVDLVPSRIGLRKTDNFPRVLTNDRRKEARWQMHAAHRRLP